MVFPACTVDWTVPRPALSVSVAVSPVRRPNGLFNVVAVASAAVILRLSSSVALTVTTGGAL